MLPARPPAARLPRASIPRGSSAVRPQTDSAAPGGTACYGDSGGPAFAYENTDANSLSRVSSVTALVLTASSPAPISCSSRASEVSSIARSPPRRRGGIGSAMIRRLRRFGRCGFVSVRQASSLCASTTTRAAARASIIAFFTRAASSLSHAYRSVATNRWARFKLQRQMQRFSGYVCAQGADGTRKRSNMQCATDVVR